jgi:hypothetical protein
LWSRDHVTNDITKRLTVTNTFPEARTFVLEPWANEHRMEPGERFVVEAKGPPDGPDLELIEEDGGYIVVWAWPGSIARVLRETGEIVEDW